MKELLSYIYNTNINNILDGFDINEQVEINTAYKSYLVETYKNSLDISNDIEKMKKIFSDLEIKRWKDKSKQEKQILLLKDEFLDRLGYLSNTALKYATDKLGKVMANLEYESPISEEQANNYIKEMEKSFSNVKEFNKGIAQIYLSEGSIDFMYAANLTENMSMRVGRMK